MSENVTTHGGHDGHDSHGGHGHAAPFSEAEMAEFVKSDVGAGAAVVVLMSAIFGIGLVLYTVIAFIVAV